ncbi:hypothetical protein Tco_0914307 [Tanacetum coccineum]
MNTGNTTAYKAYREQLMSNSSKFTEGTDGSRVKKVLEDVHIAEGTHAPVNKITPRIKETKIHTLVAERHVDTDYSKPVQKVPGSQVSVQQEHREMADEEMSNEEQKRTIK